MQKNDPESFKELMRKAQEENPELFEANIDENNKEVDEYNRKVDEYNKKIAEE